MRFNRMRSWGVLGLILVTGVAQAAEDILKPFVLASRSAGSVVDRSAEVAKALGTNGFTVVGSYAPYPGANILVVTNDELRSNAAASEHGGFGAIQRVAVSKVNDEVQVSYTNPVYMAQVYRMKGDLGNVAARLATALGKQDSFGAKGMSASQARKYHYMMGMEYFDEPSELAKFSSHAEALAAVEKGLAAGKAGVTKVYRVDVPNKEESVFGVGMKGAGDQKYMDDKYIMSEIDFKDLRSTAHLPYEVLVSGNKVYALYARFRIAIDFPDLAMMGDHSFMNIMKSPEAIRSALQKAVGN